MSDQGTAGRKLTDELLRNLFSIGRTRKADDGSAFSYAALDNFIRQSKDMLHSAKWHRAQVDALLKQRYEDCGYPDAYTPCPEQCEDDGMNNNTFMGNTIISDNALNKLITALNPQNPVEPPDQPQPPTEPPTQPQPPVEPPAQPEPPIANRPWWKIVAGTLASVILGATLIFLAWKAFGQPPSRYELIAEPFNIPEQLEYER